LFTSLCAPGRDDDEVDDPLAGEELGSDAR
jgi:hypothetical protein